MLPTLTAALSQEHNKNLLYKTAAIARSIYQCASLVGLLMVLSACTGISSNYSELQQIELKINLEHKPVNTARFNQPPYLAIQNKYRQWLIAKAVAPERLKLLLADASQIIIHIVDLQNGDLPEMQFPTWFVAGGKIPTYRQSEDDESLMDLSYKTMPTDFKQPSIHSALYIGQFFQKYRCYADNIPLSKRITLNEYRHLHTFLLNENIRTLDDYELAETSLKYITSNKHSIRNKQC